MEAIMKKFYITFGFSHALAGNFLSIEAEIEANARQAAAIMFPNRWAGIYTRQPEGNEIKASDTAENLIRNSKPCGWHD
jgi:hypothetical protein